MHVNVYQWVTNFGVAADAADIWKRYCIERSSAEPQADCIKY